MIEIGYPLLGGAGGGFVRLNKHFPLLFAFLTHPYPSRGGDNVLLLGIYPFEFRLSLTAMGRDLLQNAILYPQEIPGQARNDSAD